MRRGYIEVHADLKDAYVLARRWAGDVPMTLIGPSTSALDASPWPQRSGLPLGTTSNRHSRYNARPIGAVIAWCLHLDEILEMERRSRIDGIVVVRAMDQHASWITAHEVDHVGGDLIKPVPEASAAIKATVRGLTGIAVRNQGLVDSRERSGARQALTYLYHHGHELSPDQLSTEALRNAWPGTSPIELAGMARDLNAGKTLRFERRIVQRPSPDGPPARTSDSSRAPGAKMATHPPR